MEDAKWMVVEGKKDTFTIDELGRAKYKPTFYFSIIKAGYESKTDALLEARRMGGNFLVLPYWE